MALIDDLPLLTKRPDYEPLGDDFISKTYDSLLTMIDATAILVPPVAKGVWPPVKVRVLPAVAENITLAGREPYKVYVDVMLS